jgi:hypothetical protein
MRSTIAGYALLGAMYCIMQPAAAQDRLNFWTSGGEHGIDECVFVTMPTEKDFMTFGRLTFGVTVDRRKLELVGTVRLRQDDASSGPWRLKLGFGRQTALNVSLPSKDGKAARADLASDAMEDVLRAVMRQPTLWIRIQDANGRTVEQSTFDVGANEAEVASCLSVLKRDLAQERALRAAGGISDRF